jgi:hypothetical protein
MIELMFRADGSFNAVADFLPTFGERYAKLKPPRLSGRSRIGKNRQ